MIQNGIDALILENEAGGHWSSIDQCISSGDYSTYKRNSNFVAGGIGSEIIF